VLPALLALAACSGTENTGPERLSLNGTWRQSGDLRDTATGDSHIHLGTFALVQSGDSFSGTGEQSGFCSAASGNYAGPLADPTPFAVSGTLVGREVSFRRDICEYHGSFVEGRSNRITGTATCRYNRNGVDYVFAGQWQADKQ
jgi:hypothetical protein